MSIGLFAAAATATSSSLADLAYNGAKSVRVAFAFCVHVGYISSLLETPGIDEGRLSWAYVVTGLSVDSVQEQLDRYNTETVSHDLCLSTFKSLAYVSLLLTHRIRRT